MQAFWKQIHKSQNGDIAFDDFNFGHIFSFF